MGYWVQDAEGHSFAEENVIGYWGDAPADLMADAVDGIVKDFEETFNRLPSLQEIRAGLEFTLGAFKPNEVMGAPDVFLPEVAPPVEA